MEEVLNRLYSYSKFGIKLGLENMNRLLAGMGNPESKYKIIHIAGTNGKGSTASMIEAVLMEAGYKVGKYTSPHLVRFNERIVVNSAEISDTKVAEYFETVEKIARENGIKPTFFEITTAMMFAYFAHENVDYAVVETGMGGKYDATNVINPECSVITSVSLDHMEYLGDTVYKIACEKAGIIKPGRPVVFSGKNEDLKMAVVERTDKYIDVYEKHGKAAYEFDFDRFSTRVFIGQDCFYIPLFGAFQADNFLLAYEALKTIGISDEVIKRGLCRVKWSGRFEVAAKNPYIIIDGAHNDDSSERLAETFAEIFSGRKSVLITSVLKDKDAESIMKNMAKVIENVVFTSLDEYERGTTGEELLGRYGKYFKNSSAINRLDAALKYSRESGYEVILIAGSFYLVGEFKKLGV